jgi:uncharacterized protein DUF3987
MALSEVQKRAANFKARRAGEPEPYPEVENRATPEKIDFSQYDPDSFIKEEDVDLPDYAVEINQALDTVSIFDVYDRFFGKQNHQEPGGRTESVMAQCPNTHHADKKWSAWFGTSGGKWLLACPQVCDEGWDKFSLAGLHYGLDHKVDLWEIKTKLARDFLNLTILNTAASKVLVEESAPEPESSDTTAKPDNTDTSEPAAEEPSSNVSSMFLDDEEAVEEQIGYPSIDWKHIIPEETFLWEYMAACSVDDSPEEYHFWHGLLAIGHACGRDTILGDIHAVYGNLLICLLGGTGFGKSTSRQWLDALLKKIMPESINDLEMVGVKLVGTPSSGEYLVRNFQHAIKDINNPKAPARLTSVNGLVTYDEFSGLFSRANRQGSTLKPVIMELADCRDTSTGSMTHGEVKARDPFCSIVSSTQPRAVRSIINRTDAASGFLNRWLFVGGPPKRRSSLRPQGFAVDLAEAEAQFSGIRGWAAIGHTLELDNEAYKLWDDFFHNVIAPAQTSDRTDLLKRLDLVCKKLILLFAANKHESVVSASTIEQVIQVYDYIVACYGIIDAEIGVTAQHELYQEIEKLVIKHVAKTGRGMSVNDLRRYMNLHQRSDYTLDDVRKALFTLEKLNIVTVDKAKGPGRPTVRYRMAEEKS